MPGHKFDPKKLERLEDPGRLSLLDLDRLVQTLGLHSVETMAEVGAGTGLYAAALLERLPEARCYALDIAPGAVEWMRLNRPEAAAGRLVPLLMGEASVPLPDESVDFVFTVSVHHELDDPEALLGECLRVLVPGGRLLVADTDPERAPEGHGPPRDHLVSPKLAKTHVERAGFQQVRFLDLSPQYYCIAGVKN